MARKSGFRKDHRKALSEKDLGSVRIVNKVARKTRFFAFAGAADGMGYHGPICRIAALRKHENGR
jgi:hypothetical protein